MYTVSAAAFLLKVLKTGGPLSTYIKTTRELVFMPLDASTGEDVNKSSNVGLVSGSFLEP